MYTFKNHVLSDIVLQIEFCSDVADGLVRRLILRRTHLLFDGGKIFPGPWRKVYNFNMKRRRKRAICAKRITWIKVQRCEWAYQCMWRGFVKEIRVVKTASDQRAKSRGILIWSFTVISSKPFWSYIPLSEIP